MAGNIRPSGDGYLVGTYTVDNAAISRGQFVSFYTPDGTVRACNASSAPFGVALTDGDVGDRIEIVRGYCLALAGAAVTAGVSECSVDSTGRLVAAGDYTSAQAYVAANPLATAAAAGDLFPVFVNAYLSRADHS
jgi:hypothetical protein